ncbi:ester cyclase [Promicromonospora sukumoe]|uniref:Putative ester cyclase n=1 Tax=Promicromonospora sukumoe TaxID=88382 RepID=A0A7W3J6I4_9MICO|nr:ester cyclase [Promicromonospora sukumoe]MBA8807205.1 putative ester cyclase [Promicromonospora sukumoe]
MPDFDPREFYHRYIEALNAHDFDRMDEFVHDEIVMHSRPSSRAELVEQLHSISGPVPDMHWEIDEILVSGDWIGARVINTGTPVQEWLGVAPTGKGFEIAEYGIYTVRDGRFSTMSALHDEETLRKQLVG